jgi:type IV pilus assembly protein PilA
MIVVAIIGILAAIAIPQYQNYTKRAKISDVMSLAAGDKTRISEYYSTNGEIPKKNAAAGDGTDAVTDGVDISSPDDSQYVDAVDYNPGKDTASIAYTLENVGSGADGQIITWKMDATTSNATLKWTCTTDGVNTNLLPKSCQGSTDS